MSDLTAYVRGLAGEIGPRPVSTEEERAGAERIAHWFEEADLKPDIEEFNTPTWAEWPYAACYLIAFIAALLTAVHGAVGVVALILALIALGAFAYMRFLGGDLSRFLFGGVSQNVVAKYIPRSVRGESRRRKIVLVAHYDSERTAFEAMPALVKYQPLIQKILLGCMVALPVLMIIGLFLSGIVSTVFWVITFIVSLVPLIFLVLALLHRFVCAYNDGANDNASGIAVMMGVAHEIVPAGNASEQDDNERPLMHDGETAHATGAVDEDVPVSYERTEASPEDKEGSAGSGVRERASELAAEAPEKLHVLAEEAASRLEKAGKDVKGAAVQAAHAASTFGHSVANGKHDTLPEAEPRKAAVSPSTTTSVSKASVPDWWARAESKRKDTSEAQDAEELSRVRSRFADTPSSDYHRDAAQATERGGAHVSRKQAEAANSRVAASNASTVAQLEKSEARKTDEGTGTAAGETRAFTPVEAEDAKAAAADKGKDVIFDSEGMSDEVTGVLEPVETDEEPIKGETVVMPLVTDDIDAEAPAPEKVETSPEEDERTMRRNRKLRTLPSVEGDHSYAGFDHEADGTLVEASRTVDEPSDPPALFNDFDFGETQAAPISSDFSDTPQAGDSGSWSSEALEPAITTVEEDDSPLAGGTFAAGETGAFVPISGSTGPIADAPFDEVDVIDDADDSAVGTGDFDAPNSIDMPKKHGIFGKFFGGRKSKESEAPMNEWLDVDEDFEATSAGAQIGSWDNFDDTGKAKSDTTPDDEFDIDFDDDFSGKDDDDFGWKGGAVVGRAEKTQAELAHIRENAQVIAKRDLLNKEVWFVALGAGGAGNAGMKAFIDQHADDLRGSVFVNLEAVGAGNLSVVSSEGVGFPRMADRRVSNVAKKAAKEIDINLETHKLEWRDTDVTPMLRAGHRGITFMGFDGEAPVAWRTKRDTVDCIEPRMLDKVCALVTEIIRNS